MMAGEEPPQPKPNTTFNPLQIEPTEDERGDPNHNEEDELARKAMAAMGYNPYDYDDYKRKQRGEPRYPNGSTGRIRTMFGEANWPYRLLYVVLHLFVLVVIIMTPTSIWTSGSEVVLAMLLIITTVLFFFLQGSDPGYVDAPQGHVPPDNVTDEAVQDEIESGFYADRNMQPLNAQEGMVEEQPERGEEESMLEWNNFPPMRTIYCKAKKKYVAKFDHFCMFLNTPIGEKNHCLFWWFLLFETMLISHGIAILKTGFHWFSGDHSTAIVQAMCEVVVLDLMLLMIGGLWIFHSFLAIVSLTTYEFMRADTVPYLSGTEDFDFPFSDSPVVNLRRFCWTSGFELLLRPNDWRPMEWKRPIKVNTRSEDCWKHPWQNRYYSCC